MMEESHQEGDKGWMVLAAANTEDDSETLCSVAQFHA